MIICPPVRPQVGTYISSYSTKKSQRYVKVGDYPHIPSERNAEMTMIPNKFHIGTFMRDEQIVYV